MKLFSAAAIVLAAANSATAFAPTTGSSNTCMRSNSAAVLSMSTNNSEEDRRSFVTKSATGVAATALATSTTFGAPLVVNAAASKQWRQIKVPFEDTVYDIDFDSPTHGYIVGARGSFAETNDGGLTWEPRSFSNLDAEEEITYRFQVVSFNNGEGWVLGKPTLLLHTKDGGKSWERIPLSPKLPGEPTGILATGPNSAEMITSSGAVYTTENAGRNWKAQVKETIDATLNRVSSSGVSGASYFTGSIVNEQRDSKGAYLAVSSRGNFFLTWEPGQDFWIPHNRGTSRRIQNMGFVRGDIKNGLWMTLNGGKLLVSDSSVDLASEEFPFNEANIKTGGYGITDVAWRTDDEVWAVGGSNTMFVSKDNGKNFQFDKSANDIPGNLYNVKFMESGGWALGSNGLLLKYEG
jgi:photosystem II stability/assembly factor-like uncharacterized protein